MPIAQLKRNLGDMAADIEDGEAAIKASKKIIKQKKLAYKLLKAQISALENLPKVGYEIKKIADPQAPEKHGEG